MQMKTWWALVGARSKLRSKVKFFNFVQFSRLINFVRQRRKNCKKRGKWYTHHSSNKTSRKKFGSCWFSIFNNFLNIFLMPLHIHKRPDKGSCSTICTFNVFTARCANKHPCLFSLHLIYLSTAACISGKINLGPCWRKDFFKGQRSSTNHKMLLFVSWRNKYVIIEWPLFDAPTSIHGVLTSFSISHYCCLHFWKNKVGSMLAQRFFKGQKSSKNHKMFLFVSWGNKFVIIEWPPFDVPTSTHGAFTSFSLSRCCCLHFCRNKFGLMLAQGYFKGQRSSIIYIVQLFMTLCDMQSSSGNYLMCHQVPMASLLLFSLSKCCFLHFCRNKFGLLLAQGYLRRAVHSSHQFFGEVTNQVTKFKSPIFLFQVTKMCYIIQFVINISNPQSQLNHTAHFHDLK